MFVPDLRVVIFYVCSWLTVIVKVLGIYRCELIGLFTRELKLFYTRWTSYWCPIDYIIILSQQHIKYLFKN